MVCLDRPGRGKVPHRSGLLVRGTGERNQGEDFGGVEGDDKMKGATTALTIHGICALCMAVLQLAPSPDDTAGEERTLSAAMVVMRRTGVNVTHGVNLRLVAI
jgi:hypothetical protein